MGRLISQAMICRHIIGLKCQCSYRRAVVAWQIFWETILVGQPGQAVVRRGQGPGGTTRRHVTLSSGCEMIANACRPLSSELLQHPVWLEDEKSMLKRVGGMRGVYLCSQAGVNNERPITHRWPRQCCEIWGTMLS